MTETAYGKTYVGRNFTFKDGVFKIINENDELMPVTAEVLVEVRNKHYLRPDVIAAQTDETD